MLNPQLPTVKLSALTTQLVDRALGGAAGEDHAVRRKGLDVTYGRFVAIGRESVDRVVTRAERSLLHDVDEGVKRSAIAGFVFQAAKGADARASDRLVQRMS